MGLNWLGANEYLPLLSFGFGWTGCAQALSIFNLQGRFSCPFGTWAGTGCGWKRMKGPRQVVSATQSDHAVLLLYLQCWAPHAAWWRLQEGPATASTQLWRLPQTCGLGLSHPPGRSWQKIPVTQELPGTRRLGRATKQGRISACHHAADPDLPGGKQDILTHS